MTQINIIQALYFTKLLHLKCLELKAKQSLRAVINIFRIFIYNIEYSTLLPNFEQSYWKETNLLCKAKGLAPSPLLMNSFCGKIFSHAQYLVSTLNNLN